MRRVLNHIIADVVTADRNDRMHARVAVVDTLRAGRFFGRSYLGGLILGFLRESSERWRQMSAPFSGYMPAYAPCWAPCRAIAKTPQQTSPCGWQLRIPGRA